MSSRHSSANPAQAFPKLRLFVQIRCENDKLITFVGWFNQTQLAWDNALAVHLLQNQLAALFIELATFLRLAYQALYWLARSNSGWYTVISSTDARVNLFSSLYNEVIDVEWEVSAATMSALHSRFSMLTHVVRASSASFNLNGNDVQGT